MQADVVPAALTFVNDAAPDRTHGRFAATALPGYRARRPVPGPSVQLPGRHPAPASMSSAVLSAGNRPVAGRSVLPALPDSDVPGSAEVRLARAEYWLLLQAATLRLPLWVVAAPEGPPWRGSIEEALNCRGHGLPRDALARTLLRLARRGWIHLYHWHMAAERREPLDVSRHAVAAGFERRPGEDGHAFYELTSSGGAVFEAFARPEWGRYVEDGLSWDTGAELDDRLPERQVVAADRRRLDEYLSAVRQECDVLAGSEVFRERTDWQPVYWKPPRAGVECRLRCRERPPLERLDRGTALQQRSWCEWGG